MRKFSRVAARNDAHIFINRVDYAYPRVEAQGFGVSAVAPLTPATRQLVIRRGWTAFWGGQQRRPVTLFVAGRIDRSGAFWRRRGGLGKTARAV